MAKKKPSNGEGQSGEETISGYFRRVFAENPKWLGTRSNDAVSISGTVPAAELRKLTAKQRAEK